MHCKIAGLSDNNTHQEVQRLMKELELSPHADQQIWSYSCGNRRKLSLGIALAGDPSTLVVDGELGLCVFSSPLTNTWILECNRMCFQSRPRIQAQDLGFDCACKQGARCDSQHAQHGGGNCCVYEDCDNVGGTSSMHWIRSRARRDILQLLPSDTEACCARKRDTGVGRCAIRFRTYSAR